MRFTRQKSKTSLDSVLENRDLTPIIDSKEDKIDDILNKKHFKERAYLKALSKFLKNEVDYEFMKLNKLNDVKKAFSNFVKDPKSSIDLSIDVSYILSGKDILKLDDRFEIKIIYFCRACKKRYKNNCCDAEPPNPKIKSSKRKNILYVLNMNIKDEWMDIKDEIQKIDEEK